MRLVVDLPSTMATPDGSGTARSRRFCHDQAVPIVDYFTSSDDKTAERAIDEGPEALGFPTLPANGIDPSIAVGELESLLTGVPVGDVNAMDRHCRRVRQDDEPPFVVTVTDSLRDALAGATDDVLRQVASQWAATDQLAGDVSAADALDFLTRFAVLARGAIHRGDRLYCWWAL